VLLSSDPALSKGYELTHTFIESVGGKKPSLMFNERPAYWISPKQEYDEARHHLRQNFRNAMSTEVFQEKGGSVFFNGLMRMLSAGKIPVEKIKFFQVNMPTKHIIESIMDECEKIGISRLSLYSRLSDLGYVGPPMVLSVSTASLKMKHCKKGIWSSVLSLRSANSCRQDIA